MTEKHLTNQRFTDFDLDPAVLRGIQEAGFEYCTPIQAETLPHLLRGQDVAGQAKTGTGKTAAFLLALFQHLIANPVSAERTASQPTRELAIQIDKDARLLGRYLSLTLRLVYGGTGYEKQRQELREGVDVLIGTPGRIIDYLKQGIFSLDAIQVMVLDEADRMFDLGFIKDIRYLFRRMPKPTERLNMLFSATLSLRVNELAYEHMNNPRVVKIESDRLTVDQVTQRVYFPSNEDKLPLLLGVLRQTGGARALVFLNTKHQSEYVARRLQRSGFNAGVLSGDVPQKKRESLLNRFKEGEIHVLVATDVAARGLHIPDVSLVVNYDLPQDPEDYVHRIGRTARAGAAGDAVSFACETYAFSLPEIEGFIGHKIEPGAYSSDMLVQPSADDPAPARAGARSRERGRDRTRDRGGRQTGRVRERTPRSAATRDEAETAEAAQVTMETSEPAPAAGDRPEDAGLRGAPDTLEERVEAKVEPPEGHREQPGAEPRAEEPVEGGESPREVATQVSREFSQKTAWETSARGTATRGGGRRDSGQDSGRSSGEDSGRPSHQHKPGRGSHEVPAVG
jgi:ATP-dependent RNA helicase RhlB